MKTTITKAKARKESIIKRQLLDNSLWKKKSNIIQDKLINLPFFKEADTILCYMDVRGETGTEHIIKMALKENKKVALPKSYDSGIMEFFYIESLDDLIIGKYNIKEPKGSNRCPGDKGVLVMPGTAFDKLCNRVGYGKGYYDRYLKNHKNLKTAAICFSFQIYEEIEHNDHDIKPNVIITEKEIIYAKQSSKWSNDAS